MSVQAITWAFAQKTGSPLGRLILVTLANYADDKGKCWPSQEQIASDCECSKRAVINWIAKLESAGLLRRERRSRNDGSRTTDAIFLSLSAPRSREPYARELDDSLGEPRSRQGEPDSPLEPSLNHQTEPSRERARVRAPSEAEQIREHLDGVLDVEHRDAIIAHRRRKRSPLTPRAAKLLAGQFSQVDDPNAAADMMILNGWTGFEAEWWHSRRQPRGQPPPSQPKTELEMMAGALSEMKRRNGNDEQTGRDSGLGGADVLALPSRQQNLG